MRGESPKSIQAGEMGRRGRLTRHPPGRKLHGRFNPYGVAARYQS